MLSRYKTLYKSGCKEIEIKRSKFIGYARQINSEKDAIKFIEEIRSKHRQATHNVYAYVFGERDEIQRYSDDGEPSGTGGIPVLNVIKMEGLKNTAVVVTRYFGGILLGAGGLARAYGKSAKAAIDDAVIVEKILFRKISIIIEYTLLGIVQNDLIKNEYFIKSIDYTDKVKINVYIEEGKKDYFIEHIKNLTKANLILKEDNNLYLYKKGEKYLE
ncbi:YigZ family protein [Aceticella autotrophica]|uniref:YigZ family protein n=1 Tax=Aceticella autotrophica TaxID=2755338 RepID=A0A975GA23_9THEO|nr:YigZ family protein [Aceticella autotrophica]QSZ26742.1 YigZ family protein [Aceticella autotrophica]